MTAATPPLGAAKGDAAPLRVLDAGGEEEVGEEVEAGDVVADPPLTLPALLQGTEEGIE